MNYVIFLSLLSLPSLVFSQENLDRQDQVIDSRYLYWCLGDLDGAQKSLGVLDHRSSTAEVFHRADLFLAQNERSQAIQMLFDFAQKSTGQDQSSLVRRLYSIEPEYRQILQEDHVFLIPLVRLKELQRLLQAKGFKIKEGIIFQRRVSREDSSKLLAFRLLTMQGRGQILSEFGFNLGDDIVAVNGTPVARWGWAEAFKLALSLSIGQDVVVEVVPQGSLVAQKRLYRFRSDIEVIEKYLEIDQKDENDD